MEQVEGNSMIDENKTIFTAKHVLKTTLFLKVLKGKKRYLV